MRLTYHNYHLTRAHDGETFSFSLRDFLAGFCQVDDPAFKASFVYDGEHIYIKHYIGNLFIVFITRNTEIIRKLNTTSLDDNDLRDLLEEDENIAFASYVLVEDSFLAFGSTQLACKMPTFAEFISMVMERTRVQGYTFSYTPIFTETTYDDAVALPFIGRTHLSLSAHNDFTQELMGYMGVDVNDAQLRDLDGIEVILRPKRRKNINGIAGSLLNRVRGRGVNKVHLRGMSEEEQDRLTDLYIEARGPIHDSIDPTDRLTLQERINERIESNVELNRVLREQENDENQHEPLPRGIIDDYFLPAGWAAIAAALQGDN